MVKIHACRSLADMKTLNIHYTLGVTTSMFGPVDVSISIGCKMLSECIVTDRRPKFL